MIKSVLKKVSWVTIIPSVLFVVPLVSYAAPVCESYIPGRLREFKDFVCLFVDLISVSIPVIVGLMLLVFFWGLAKFIFRVGGDEKAVDEGKRIMLWGVVALFVMVSVWGLVNFLVDAFGFNNTSGPFPGQLAPPDGSPNNVPLPWYDPEGTQYPSP